MQGGGSPWTLKDTSSHSGWKGNHSHQGFDRLTLVCPSSLCCLAGGDGCSEGRVDMAGPAGGVLMIQERDEVTSPHPVPRYLSLVCMDNAYNMYNFIVKDFDVCKSR